MNITCCWKFKLCQWSLKWHSTNELMQEILFNIYWVPSIYQALLKVPRNKPEIKNKQKGNQTWIQPSQSLKCNGENSPQPNNYSNSNITKNFYVFSKTLAVASNKFQLETGIFWFILLRSLRRPIDGFKLIHTFQMQQLLEEQ